MAVVIIFVDEFRREGPCAVGHDSHLRLTLAVVGIGSGFAQFARVGDALHYACQQVVLVIPIFVGIVGGHLFQHPAVGAVGSGGIV